MQFRKFSILALLLLSLAACGKRGPVRPLLHALPGAPQNLAIQQLGRQFLLSWAIPRVNQDGSPLTDLQGFQVYKMTYDPARDCPECRDTSILMESLDLDYLQGARREGDRLLLRIPGLEAGQGYQFRVVPVTRRGRSGLAATVRRICHLPPPPGGLTASGHDQMARLSWSPPATPPADLTGYAVYRRIPGQPFPLQPVSHQPPSARQFEDFGLENGTTYIYGLRSVAKVDGDAVESDLSDTAVVTPRPGQ